MPASGSSMTASVRTSRSWVDSTVMAGLRSGRWVECAPPTVGGAGHVRVSNVPSPDQASVETSNVSIERNSVFVDTEPSPYVEYVTAWHGASPGRPIPEPTDRRRRARGDPPAALLRHRRP